MPAIKISDKKFSIKKTYVVYASPEKVFEALTDPGLIAAWGGGLSIVENKTGGKFEMFDGWVKGEVHSFKPGKELSYTWKPEEWKTKTPHSLVTYKFMPHPAGTDVILEHTGLPSQEETDKHSDGWMEFVFEPLNEFFTR